MLRYIARFVSLESGKGKTHIASKVVAKLKSLGYSVSVVKHAVHGIDIEDKDSHVYIKEDADLVVLSSNNLGVIYRRKWVDTLEYALSFANTPIVIVEGFKHSRIGDVIAIADSREELMELEQYIGDTIVAIVTSDPSIEFSLVGKKIFGKSNINDLVDFIIKRAIECIESRLPGNNCGSCGFPTCRLFVETYMKNPGIKCPMKSQARLIVNDIEIDLNPFVKKLLISILEGFVKPLKDVPRDIHSLAIEIRY